MNKSVRYYITESDDRPVVRTVSVAVRPEQQLEPQRSEPVVVEMNDRFHNSRRSRLRSRLKTARSHRHNS